MTRAMILTEVRALIEAGDLSAAEALLPPLSPAMPTALNLATRIRLGLEGMLGALHWLETHRDWLPNAPGPADILINALACLRPSQMTRAEAKDMLGHIARLDALPLAPVQRRRLRAMHGPFARAAAEAPGSATPRLVRAGPGLEQSPASGEGFDAARQAALALTTDLPAAPLPKTDRPTALALLELIFIEDHNGLAGTMPASGLSRLADGSPFVEAIIDGLDSGRSVLAEEHDPAARRLLALTWLRAHDIAPPPPELRTEWIHVLTLIAGRLDGQRLRQLLAIADLANWPILSLDALTETLILHPVLSRSHKLQLLEIGLASSPAEHRQAFEKVVDLHRDVPASVNELRAGLSRWPQSQKLWRLLFRETLRAGQEDPGLLVDEMCRARPDLHDVQAAAWHALALTMARRPAEAVTRLEAGASLHAIMADRDMRVTWARAVVETGDVVRMQQARPYHARLGAMGMRMAGALEAIDRLDVGGRIGQALCKLPDDLFGIIRREAPAPYCPAPEAGILVVTSSLGAGGAERQTAATVNAMDGMDGRRVTLVAADLSSDLRRDFFLPALTEQGRRVIDLSGLDPMPPGNAFARHVLAAMPPDIARLASGLCTVIEAERPALIHAWQDTTNIAAAVAALIAGCPSVILSCRSLRPTAFKRARPWLHRAYCEILDDPRFRIINNSRAGALDYASWLGIPVERIGVIENGMPLARMRALAGATDRAATRRGWGVPPDALVVGGVMRMSEEKRPDLFVATMIALCRMTPRLHAVLAGRGPMEDELKATVARAGLAERIHFPGHVSPVEPAMAAFDLLFLSSRIEGLPNVVIEAQALGIPVASMNVGGVGEALSSFPYGLLLDEAAPGELARRLSDFIKQRRADPATPAMVADFAQRRFSMEAMQRKTAAAYRAAL